MYAILSIGIFLKVILYIYCFYVNKVVQLHLSSNLFYSLFEVEIILQNISIERSQSLILLRLSRRYESLLFYYIMHRWSWFIPTTDAITKDHLNDVMSNTAALVFTSIAFHATGGWWVDPVGAIAISLTIIYRWTFMMWEQVSYLSRWIIKRYKGSTVDYSSCTCRLKKSLDLQPQWNLSNSSSPLQRSAFSSPPSLLIIIILLIPTI